MTDSKKTNAFIWPLSAAAALLVALIAGIGARLETGAPPGLAPKPFAHLLGRFILGMAFSWNSSRSVSHLSSC